MTKTKSVSKNENSLGKRAFALLQRVGKSLLFPIAMLPIAAIFLRVGAAIPQDTKFSEFIGQLFISVAEGVFDDALPFLFAIGIAFGMTKDNRGEAAIVGFSVMVILTVLISTKGNFGGNDFVDKIYGGVDFGNSQAGVAAPDGTVSSGLTGFHQIFDDVASGKQTYNSILAKNVFTGIFAGSIVAFIYNKFNGIELPSLLGFFSGRRLVPVLASMATIFLGLLYALIWPWFGVGLYYIGKGMGEAQGNHWANAGIMGGYGIINRLLIPFGLHHVINTPLWFTAVGGTQGTVSGDINIFGQAPALGNHSGTFQSGFFPTMMFGLPAIAFAIYHNAKGNTQKARVASLFAGSALVSFFTGITEPIEFSFMFLAPGLYMVHAVLTGVFGFIVGVFGIQLGFGFSAGLFDYLLSLPKSLDIVSANKSGFEAVMANPLWMPIIGAGAAAAYFFSANFLIKKFNWSTPGRGTNLLSEDKKDDSATIEGGTTARAQKYVEALGGYENIKAYAHCATRLRYDIKDMSKVDEKALQTAGAFGVSKPSKTHVQVIVGPTVEIVNNEILAGKPETVKAKVTKGEVASKTTEEDLAITTKTK